MTTKTNNRPWRNFTMDDHRNDTAVVLRSPIRRCADCSSLEWTIIEGEAVCRRCGEVLKKAEQ